MRVRTWFFTRVGGRSYVCPRYVGTLVQGPEICTTLMLYLSAFPGCRVECGIVSRASPGLPFIDQPSRGCRQFVGNGSGTFLMDESDAGDVRVSEWYLHEHVSLHSSQVTVRRLIGYHVV